MSCEIKYKCDHCGDDVSPYIGKQWRASMLTVGPSMDDIHACSKEHLGFAVANAFGVPIDANAAAIALTRNVLHSSNEAKASRIAELEAHAATLTGLASQYKADRDSLEETRRMHSARVIELEKQLPARRDVESDHYYNAAFDGVDYGKVAYERFRELPATPKDAAPWDRLKGAERNEWRAIVEPVVERVRAEKSRPSIVADNETIERFAVIVGENGGESLSSAEMERIAKAVIETITDTTKPTKPAMAVEEPEARLEVKQTKWVCVEEGRAEAMREAWQKAISNGDNARVIFADGSQES